MSETTPHEPGPPEAVDQTVIMASAAALEAPAEASAGRVALLRVIAIALVLIIVGSLSGSIGFNQKAAGDPVKRIAAITHGRLTPAAYRALAQGMYPHELQLAANNLPGQRAWHPGGPMGWPVYDIESPPSLIWRDLSFDEARDLNSLVPASALNIPPMKPFKLAGAGAERERALLCLTQAVYYEAGFESGEGQQAVAQVVLNRMRHPAYPQSVCGVVYQGSQRLTGCQFSFTCDGSLKRPAQAAAWQRARQVAQMALNGFVYKSVGTSTHYHADYVFPYWAVTLVKLRQIGAHIFYRMTGPTGSPDAFYARYAGGELSLPESVLTGGDTRTPDAPSAITPPTLPLAAGTATVAATRLVTLESGGETRTYTVANTAPGALPPVPTPGVLQPSRRAPTPEEIQRINETVAKFEDDQKAAQAAQPAPPPAAPAPPPPPPKPQRAPSTGSLDPFFRR